MATAPADIEATLVRDTGGYVAVHKAMDAGSEVYYGATPVGKYEGEVQVELSQLIETAVRTKREKIYKKGVLSESPDVILALYDAYGYADVATVRKLSPTSQASSFFTRFIGPRPSRTNRTRFIPRAQAVQGRSLSVRMVPGAKSATPHEQTLRPARVSLPWQQNDRKR
jgi:hypothetical protein